MKKKRTAQKTKKPVQKTKALAKASKTTGKPKIAGAKTRKTATERKKPSHIKKIAIKEQPHALFSQQWMSESTLMAKTSKSKNSPSGSGAPPPPPPKDLTLSVSPGILCCGEGQVITATATATGAGASKATVALSYPGGTKSKKGSVSVNYKVKKDDCGTVLAFGASADDRPTKEEQVPVVLITHITEVSNPKNRERTKLGVGEKVSLKVFPSIGKIKWALSGKGKLDNKEGHDNIFSAHDRESSATIEATMNTTKAETGVPKSITCSIVFTVIQPYGVSMTRWQNSPDWHIQGLVSAGFCAEVHIHPEDVSFARVFVKEDTCKAICTGYFMPANNETHPAWTSWGPVNQGTDHPSVVEHWDAVSTHGKLDWFIEPGSFIWKIPWLYSVDKKNGYQFAVVEHNASCDALGELTQRKAFCPPAIQALNNPNSNPSCGCF